MIKILVVEDDPAILRGLADNLRFEGYDVITASDGETGERLQKTHKPDLIVLDLMLPRLGGLDLCRRLRKEGVHTPVLMLTAKSEESDRVTGLDTGADDYVTKPFSVKELMARVRALLRRAQPQSSLPDTLRFGDVDVDFLRYEARKKGKPVEMTRKEFAILRFLASRSGQAVTRDDLLKSFLVAARALRRRGGVVSSKPPAAFHPGANAGTCRGKSGTGHRALSARGERYNGSGAGCAGSDQCRACV
jgi:DNA-binding response OmpR family regulator